MKMYVCSEGAGSRSRHMPSSMKPICSGLGLGLGLGFGLGFGFGFGFGLGFGSGLADQLHEAALVEGAARSVDEAAESERIHLVRV